MLVLSRVRKAPPRFVVLGNQPGNVDWQALHQIADAHYPAMMREFLAAIEATTDTLTQEELLSVLAHGPDAAWNRVALAWDTVGRPGLETAWTPEFTAMLRDAATATQASVAVLVPAQFQVALATMFFEVNDAAVEVARTMAGTRIQSITDTTLQGVRTAVTRAFTEGRTLDQTARTLAHTVGLTPGQVNQLINYQQGLIDQGISFARQERLMRARARQLRRRRGEVIARTETITTSSAGQHQLWDAAQAQGFMPSDLRRFWVVTPDDRLCTAICRPIPGLNPQGRGFREPFETPRGPVMHPAAHPSCRCAVTLREVS